MPAPKDKKIKIEEKKLGRRRYKGYQIVGWADNKKQIIEIDSRLKKRARMRVVIHESLHLALPELSESQVEKAEKVIGNLLWRDGYRNPEKE